MVVFAGLLRCRALIRVLGEEYEMGLEQSISLVIAKLFASSRLDCDCLGRDFCIVDSYSSLRIILETKKLYSWAPHFSEQTSLEHKTVSQLFYRKV